MKRSQAVKVPSVLIGNRQRSVELDLARLGGTANAAVPWCLSQVGRHDPVLPNLVEVEVALVSDRVIASVHRQFMDVPGATDVITFPHGEIVVSATTAAREAASRGEPVGREVLRYVVHGLLHLNGHDDVVTRERDAMWRVQEEIVARLWPLDAK